MQSGGANLQSLVAPRASWRFRRSPHHLTDLFCLLPREDGWCVVGNHARSSTLRHLLQFNPCTLLARSSNSGSREDQSSGAFGSTRLSPCCGGQWYNFECHSHGASRRPHDSRCDRPAHEHVRPVVGWHRLTAVTTTTPRDCAGGSARLWRDLISLCRFLPVRVAAARISAERDSIERVLQRNNAAQLELQRQRDSKAAEAASLCDAVATLERDRARQQSSAHQLR